MRRIALLIVVFGLLAAPARASDPATVELTSCEPHERAAEFEASMEAAPGVRRMKMRFTLQVRKPGRRAYRRVAAPGFGEWTTADRGTSRYVFTRRVEALIGPASYRAMVRFRWVGRRGRTFAAARAFSRACRQPDHRPNLRLRALSVEGRTSYVALVANTGRSETGPFELEISGLAPVAVDSLAPGVQTLVEVAGPRCKRGASVTAIADPLDLIDERNERDNVLTRPCP